MKKQLLSFFILAHIFITGAAGAFDGDAALIIGDNVRVRAEAKSIAAVVTSLRIGTVVRILEKSSARDKLGNKDAFGFYWYKVDAGRNMQGWAYGQFVYAMNGDRFVADASLLQKPHQFSGKAWLFGVAEEPAYPVSDDTGLTGSVIHALPFFLDEKSNRAVFIQCEKTGYDLGELTKPPALFRFNDSEGGSQQIKSIVINQKAQTMIIEGAYYLQDGGGIFSVTVKIGKDKLILTGFKKTPDVNK
jgi:hypothetical protein